MDSKYTCCDNNFKQALYYKNLTLIKLFLDSGLPLSRDNFNIGFYNADIMDLFLQYHLETVKKFDDSIYEPFIIKYGFNINKTEHNHQSALHYAVAYYCNEMVEFLLENGIDQNIKSIPSGTTAINILKSDKDEANKIRSIFRDFNNGPEIKEPSVEDFCPRNEV